MVEYFDPDADCARQLYGLGLTELWDLTPELHQPSLVIHTQGWPLTNGGFLYCRAEGQVT